MGPNLLISLPVFPISLKFAYVFRRQTDCFFSVSSLWGVDPPGRRLETEKTKQIQQIL
jgi:hypothetical protein